MNFNHLKVFASVAKTLSYSKAGEELHISQPTVSVQVKKLENELGISLFEQIGKKIFLTEAGATLYSYAKKIFDLADIAEDAVANLKGLKKGNLSVGAGTTAGIYILPGISKSFEQLNQGVEINLTIYSSQVIQDMVISNELEYAIIGEGVGLVPDELCVHPLITDELMAISSPEHPLAQLESISIQDLLKKRLVIRQKGSSTRDTLEERLQSLNLELKASMQFNCVEAIKKAVEAKLGVSIVSKYAISSEIKSGTLTILNVTGIDLKRNINLIYHKEKRFSPLGKAFLEFVTAEICGLSWCPNNNSGTR